MTIELIGYFDFTEMYTKSLEGTPPRRDTNECLYTPL